jgi:hypothetical protein
MMHAGREGIALPSLPAHHASRHIKISLLLNVMGLLPPLAGLAAGQTPSVILISFDTLRADRLSCYGYKRRMTPHIDAIARGGTLFSAVNAQIPLTFPSHVSMLTSTYPF